MIIVTCVCIAAFLGAITMILVPPEYRPFANLNGNENAEITFGFILEQTMTPQGLVGLLPFIYLMVAFIVAEIWERRYYY